MKRFLLYACLWLVLGALAIELIKHDQGYVIISYGSKTIDMSLVLLLFLVLIASVCFYYLLKWGRKLFILVDDSISWVALSRSNAAHKRTHSGLIHFIEGNWQAARRDLLKAARKVDNPIIHYLAAARSAYELGDTEQTRLLLREAEEVAPENELAIALSQARIHLLDHKPEQALAILKRAQQLLPKHPVILGLLKQVYWELKEWPALIDLLPGLRAHPQISDTEQRQFEKQLFSEYITALVIRFKQQHMSVLKTQDALKKAWQKVPKYLQSDSDLVTIYASQLAEVEGHELAAEVIHHFLHKNWNDELIKVYGNLQLADKKAQLIKVEKWVRERPGNPDLLLAAARISNRNELWGKAKEYFKASLSLKEQASAYAEYATLLAQLGEHEQSTALYKKGLLVLSN
ncbi:heme biosynthesis HemY N-terminal domain-containing protein [Teredinibacter sp. KSP-S5-2]|uniref:heme biosynthesis HemY N-terminal domain-containing protein n=1 Tax=Teredinibacter sp. KSP-S5-2 TaxID=3034506 RepID=UPI002934450A|nr:heme biosynthesis HemY N-terminal domain-containing protein [Teredinibacter sp. KSP-S5-2]WNO09328.1 heme biosynthesis HemY N-terminal domain-containing protein [Teredinibacter sp. KSP-S5-2]